MIKLDTTKVYYLGDLSDEQKNKLYEYLKFEYYNGFIEADYLRFNGVNWCYGNFRNNILNIKSYNENALTLFKNERISKIQLRIQELNNELIELD